MPTSEADAAPQGLAGLGVDEDTRERIRRMLQTARLLDSRIRVPGTDFTFGVDAIVGLIPSLGGPAGLVLSATVILQAIMAGAGPATVLRMVGIAGLDALVGLIPFLGSVGDFVIKANNRNARIAAAQLADPDATSHESRRTLLTAVAVLFVALGLVFWLLILLAYVILRAIF